MKRNAIARDLHTAKYRQRVVRDRTKYRRTDYQDDLDYHPDDLDNPWVERLPNGEWFNGPAKEYD